MARAMKDSGVEWIGEIPQGWERVKLGFLYSFSSGDTLAAQDFDDNGDYPVYGANGQRGYYNSFNTCGRHILIGRVGALCGNIHLINSEVWVTEHALISEKLSNLVTDEFSVYLLTAMELRQYASGTAQPVIAAEKIRKLGVPLPPKNEQVIIADYLDTECARINAVIERTRASIEEYKKLKQSVITEAVTKGIRPDRKMKDSGVEWIGEIAEDYELEKLKYVCEILDQYRSPITADQRNQNAEVLYDYYGASGAIDKIDGYTIDDHVMLIGEDGANLRMRNLPLMYEVNGKAWINNHAHILKPKDGMDFHYLFFTLEALDINPYITGSAQPKLSQDNLKNILLPVPALDEQIEIAGYIKDQAIKIDALIRKKRLYLSELETYKKSLIFEYVTGKKAVVI